MPHEGASRKAAHMLVWRVGNWVAGAIDEDAHRLRFVSRVHHRPHARRPLRVESCVDDFGTLRHRDFLLVGDFDWVFVDCLHVGVDWPFEAEQSCWRQRSKIVSRRVESLSLACLISAVSRALVRSYDAES